MREFKFLGERYHDGKNSCVLGALALRKGYDPLRLINLDQAEIEGDQCFELRGFLQDAYGVSITWLVNLQQLNDNFLWDNVLIYLKDVGLTPADLEPYLYQEPVEVDHGQ